MLVLTRKENEKIRIGDDIVLTVVRTAGDRVRIGIEAPTTVQILRSELNTKRAETLVDDFSTSASDAIIRRAV